MLKFSITHKKVAGQNQEVEGHITGCRLQRKPLRNECLRSNIRLGTNVMFDVQYMKIRYNRSECLMSNI
jgi:hypothetical protein